MKSKDIFEQLGFKELTEVQQRILNSNKNTLIVSSCGSGKTEASYFKMLETNRKTIFIEPMRTLATSIQDRLNKYNNILGLDKVTIQHSGETEDRFLQNKYAVTTIDQVLSGYLGFGRQAYIRGKNVIMSNLIFDEVQLMDNSTMLLTTINMLDEINKLKKNRIIIMTATMPEYLINFFKNRYDMEVIVTETYDTSRNVKIKYMETLDYKNVLEYNSKQIIICNTVKELREVYSKLDTNRCIVLHSKFYAKDRKANEEQVYKYFGKGSGDNNKILLTTQIVEAGIDISANRLYSSLCAIDSLVQRDGRCCRWGGEGDIIVFNSDSKIYDPTVVNKTREVLEANNGILFNWDIQKKWINNILNDYYAKNVNTRSLKRNRNEFNGKNRSKLIRNVESYNLIIKHGTVEVRDFKRNSISVTQGELNKISKSNKLYKLNKKQIIECSVNNCDFGDTIICEGNNCLYDELGFRYVEFNNVMQESDFIEGKKALVFDDYIRETWINHSYMVRDLMGYTLRKDRFNEDTYSKAEKISFYAGLHDLGKLDTEWQKKSESVIPLAHFPFTRTRGEVRTHDSIGAYALKEVINDNVIFNMILQHHKRFYRTEEIVKTSSWSFNAKAREILKGYGLSSKIPMTSSGVIVDNKDLITPYSEEYITFLYLVGTFMEVEIKCIKDWINNA